MEKEPSEGPQTTANNRKTINCEIVPVDDLSGPGDLVKKPSTTIRQSTVAISAKQH